jgi:hypothetical protein
MCGERNPTEARAKTERTSNSDIGLPAYIEEFSDKVLGPIGGIVGALIGIFMVGPTGFQIGGVGGAVVFGLVGGVIGGGLGFAAGLLLIEAAARVLFLGAIAVAIWAFFHYLWGMGKPP